MRLKEQDIKGLDNLNEFQSRGLKDVVELGKLIKFVREYDWKPDDTDDRSGYLLYGMKLEFLNTGKNNYLRIKLPTANREWTMAVFQFTNDFLKKFENCYPEFNHLFEFGWLYILLRT